MKNRWIAALLAVAAISAPAFCLAAPDPVVIGAVIAQTGPVSSLGEGEVKAINMYAKDVNAKGGIAGHPLKVVILDSAGDPQKAVLNVRKLISEDNVAGVICCTTTPESMAIIDTVQRAEVPTISLGSAATIAEPVSERHWVFKPSPTDAIMIGVEVGDMKKRGVKTVGYLGFNTALGHAGLTEFQKAAPAAGIKIVNVEQFAPSDTNLSAQGAKLAAANPDAVLIIANPPGANVAQKAIQAAGYKGTIYQTYGVTNETYLRLGGASLNGTRISVPPITVYNHLPDSRPFKPVVEKFVKDYKAAFNGEVPSNFAAFAYAGIRIFSTVAGNELSGGKAKLSDTASFRKALRDGIENLHGFQSVNGTYNFSKTDHVGLDASSITMVTVENGEYVVAH
ncbi:MAG: hypothetical protein OJF60_000288 [Burkholderiaceae bacterium]|jgi:branched-chain amino acid transport system substrate-binding protein|nr:MAG: hypothetical protein OJF60_000288 [Burkholderiaceae bacterium]